MILVCLGLIAGILASAPLLVTRADQAPLARGFACLIFAFFFLSGAIFVARQLMPEAFLAFSISSISAFLTAVVIRMTRSALRLA